MMIYVTDGTPANGSAASLTEPREKGGDNEKGAIDDDEKYSPTTTAHAHDAWMDIKPISTLTGRPNLRKILEDVVTTSDDTVSVDSKLL